MLEHFLLHVLSPLSTGGLRAPENMAAVGSPDEGSTKELAFIVQLMTKGRVEQALSAPVVGENKHLPRWRASLESLVGFAANPTPLGAMKSRMRLRDIMAKVRCTMTMTLFTSS